MVIKGDVGTSPGAPSLRVAGLVVRFGGVTALDGVSFEVTGPTVLGIVGPNGSGKSSLLGVLSGFLRPQSGKVELDGRDVTGKGPVAFARMGIRRSFQAVRLVPTLTIRDNLLVGVARARSADLARAESLAEMFGFAEHLQAWPSAVPAGIQRLVQVASVVLADPSVVLLDEPAAGLTEDEVAELSGIVSHLGKGSLVIIVEHNMQLIFELSQRVVALVNGSVVADGPVAEVRSHPKFRDAYLGLPPEKDSEVAAGKSEQAEPDGPLDAVTHG